jgi:beta-glucosidase
MSAAILAASLFTTSGPRAASRIRFSAYDGQVQALLSQMTLDEKVGQMTQADLSYLKDPTDVQRYFLGSVLSGGNSDPKTNSLEDWTDMYDGFQAQAMKTRLKIPILYGVDAVHGHSNVLKAVLFPHNVGLGATRDAALVEEIGRITAAEVRATGIQWAFSPCVTVPRDRRWGRSYEGFAEDPAVVAELGAAAVRGLQGADLKDPLRVLACAKHYAGDGGTAYGTGRPDGKGGRSPLDQGDTQLDEATLRKIHLQGYITAIDAGVGTIMPSYSSWNGQKCSGSHRLLTEILKDELGFEGFVISDYNALDDLPGDQRSQIKQSINAGMDMVMVPERYKQFYAALKNLAETGEVPMTRIDDAVKRILRVKFAMGLMDPSRSPLADRSLQKDFGSPARREVARRAVRESLVLLKNDKKTLPLSKSAKRIHVAGKSADDLGNQCGGWTISWQGESGTPTTGTTILAALKTAVSKGTAVTFSKDGTGAAGADVGLVVIGETPYAEGFGDRTDLGLAKEDLEAIANVKKAGIPVVVVLLSGRPMILGEVLAQSDALVAAWLPGSEGQGVTDVLLGDFKPAGKLPFTWPRSMAQMPINVGDAAYDPLFPYGFGLTY